MDIGRAFTFIREDPRGADKLVIGVLLAFGVALSIVTVIGWLIPLAIIYGYFVRLTRNVIAGEEYPLPEWEDWGGLLRDGIGAYLPQFLLGLALVPAALLLLLPGILLTAADATTTRGIGIALLAIAVALAQPLIVGHYAATGSVGAALRVGDLAAMLRANLVTYLIVALLGIVTNTISGLGILACGIGLPFTMFYAAMVNHHLYGQAYLRARGASSVESAPAHLAPQPFPA
jgi:hypothetical protein